MTSYWYLKGRAEGRRFTAESYRELVDKDPGLDWAERCWNQELGPDDLRYMAAVFGDPDAPLPDGILNLNTGNHTFCVLIPKQDSKLSSMAWFAARQNKIDAEPQNPPEIVERGSGRLTLTQLSGPIAGLYDPELFMSLKIRTDGNIESTTARAFTKDEGMLVDAAPWPGVGADDDRLWIPYPEFNDYETMITRAQEAFEFFLSAPDPRSGAHPPDPQPRPEPEPVAKATLSFTATRATAMTDQEKTAVAGFLASMPEVRGEGLDLWGPYDLPPILLQGSSALWGYEPVEHIVSDLHIKLNVLTRLRHALRGSEWNVELENMPCPWNDTEQRFEPPD